MNVQVDEIGAITTDLAEAISHLLGQLSTSGSRPSLEDLMQVARSPCTTLFVASVGREVAGMLTLVAVRIPTGVRTIIEDVVVDEDFRRNGIGKALIERALAKARMLGARKIDLTSSNARLAANRLYQKLGFERRETNVYRLRL